MLQPADFFDLSDQLSQSLFKNCTFVWDVLPTIQQHLERLLDGKRIIEGEVMPGAIIADGPMYIGKGARIEPGVWVSAPAYIGEGAVLRHGSFVRENVIMLPGSMLGHASEAKNALLMHDAHAPHFAYVGDSVLGKHVNLGAGTKLSNLGVLSEKDRATGKRPTIKLTIDGKLYDTGLAKFGAIVGDHTQTGCNVVLNPGCMIGARSLVYANMSLRKGYYPTDSIVKLRQVIEVVERR